MTRHEMAADVPRQHGYMGAVMSSPDTKIRRKRLLFRAWHRGTREADLLLGSFADKYLAGFDELRLDQFEAMLDCPDAELFDWLTGRAAPPAEHNGDVPRLFLAFRPRLI